MRDKLDMEPNLKTVTSVSPTFEKLSTLSREALQTAREFLQYYNWVGNIKSEYIGACVDGIIYVFLFQIMPSRENVDSWIWVIVGDVPPAYITCEAAKNPYEAVDSYLGAMEEWVTAAQNGYSIEALVPVNIDATPENAKVLEDRLKFIDSRILPILKSDLP